MQNNNSLSLQESEALIQTLKIRFEQNRKRHEGLEWAEIQAKLEANHSKLWSLNEMEQTGGEPDVVGYDKKTGEYVFFDCATESPKNRRSLCYDEAAWLSRKENKPASSVMEMANAMGVELLTETEYRALQQLGQFDTKTSSWVKTPAEIRKLGGAIFCDYRYNTVFVYHNGAESYYSARGFRSKLHI